MTQLAEDRKIATPWLTATRKAAADQFARAGYPKRDDEEWRFTSVDAIVKTKFVPGQADDSAANDLAGQYTFAGEAVTELVFVNGQFSPRLSKLGKLPRGVVVRRLADAFNQNAGEVADHLGKLASIQTNPFAALNTAELNDGAYLYFPRSTTVAQPIHLLFISTADGSPTHTTPRVLVVAEENVETTIVESYVGNGTYFTNAVTEIFVGADCRIDHCKLQQESVDAYHLAAMNVHLGAKAQFVTHSLNIGGKLTRNELGVIMGGEYAEATINGLVLMDGTRHCDNHTLLDHASANCPSHELYKHVLNGKSTGVFKGKILVRKDSQKTDSKQTSKTLLLSDDAVMNSMPALEIYADDVKCTHGSTTGPVDEEQVFYLRSRGIDNEAARHLMTYAFAADITRRIRVVPVRARIENYMAAHAGLPLDLRIADLGAHDEAVVNI